MSQINIESPKHCSKREFCIHKKLFFAVVAFLFSILLALIFIVWISLHPSRPEFSLSEAKINQLNLFTAHLLYSSIQLTLLSKNPNKKIGIYYDEMQVFASYKGQQITVYTSLPPFYQGHEDTNVLSASLTGNGLAVAPSVVYFVQRDQSSGKLVLALKAIGKLRWKVGTWVSGKYRYNVNCIVVVPFGGSSPLSSTRFKQTQCSTTL
ncbi:PREDICTED: NDR1/HIN1-like protein 12 [Ipomoea nil]|uniref:Hairpin-induced family protein n=1 Tax=Ipomoea nil TaxID=35883 RepID=Q1JUZ3_IPONI|nr:PREDICTED: NDR1/HIN1-like protein 12 [Ipomoea nil]BAE94402.1 Hairpin-induced family protein [Ipomoea nil]BAE94405.1 Hairpin-induced family protein [Ipomoea nil]BAE94408.1 Hairpin-induced family protein [Ipomoea nil]